MAYELTADDIAKINALLARHQSGEGIDNKDVIFLSHMRKHLGIPVPRLRRPAIPGPARAIKPRGGKYR